MTIKNFIRRAAERLGYDITARNFLRSHTLRRAKFLADGEITRVLDVGANAGQYGRSLRDAGFAGDIVSFEPLAGVFRELQACAAGDPRWTVLHTALGAETGSDEIHVADFSQVSSILPATGRSDTGHWQTERTETVSVQRLDDLFENLVRPGERVHLKLDVQGFERQVLTGAAKSLPAIDMLELELSVEEMYAGETLLPEMLNFLQTQGFQLASLEDVHVHPTSGRVLQYDGLFLRTPRIETF